MSAGRGRPPRLVERAPGGLIGDELEAIFAQAISGLVLRGFLSPADCADIQGAVRAGLPPLGAAPFPGVTYGAVLVVSPPELSAYRAAGRALSAALAPWGVEAALGGLFEAMGAPAAATPEGYAALTVRALAPGQAVAVHSERQDWPSMAELSPLLEPATTLSFYVPLALGERGGELVIYHRPPPGLEPAIGGAAPARAAELLAGFGETRVRPGVGDLLIFDGGRFNHRVSPSDRERWTLGGFAARGLDGRLLFWS